MTAVTETLVESKQDACNIPDCSCKVSCPADCPCLQESTSSRVITVLINCIGVLLAVLATYMIITTDSKLYIVFWISYSILRRMMTKNKKHMKSD